MVSSRSQEIGQLHIVPVEVPKAKDDEGKQIPILPDIQQ